MADILLTLAALLLCAATLLPLLRHDAWWVRAGDFPRMQLATLLTLLLAAQAILYRGESWQLALMLPVAGCLGLQLWWILPYTPLWRREVRRARGDGCDIRIMTANVLTPNRNADGLLALVAYRKRKQDQATGAIEGKSRRVEARKVNGSAKTSTARKTGAPRKPRS